MNTNACKTYRVPEIADMLGISPKSAYNLCNTNPPFKVYRIGKSTRVGKDSFDAWFNNPAA